MVKHISQYDPSREFEPWLTRICVNTYRSTLRRLAKSPLLDFSNGEEKDRLLASIPAPEKTDYAPLYEAVGQLPEKLRLAVILFYFQGEDLASAAQILHIPVGRGRSGGAPHCWQWPGRCFRQCSSCWVCCAGTQLPCLP